MNVVEERPARIVGRAFCLPLLTMFAAASCVAGEQFSMPLDINAQSIERINAHSPLKLVSAHTLHGPELGGVSAVVASEDAVTLFGDRGQAWRARIDRQADGRIDAIRGWRHVDLPRLPLRSNDLESASRAGSGIVIATEHDHGMVRLEDRPGGFVVVGAASRPKSFAGAPGNGGIEALATIDDYHLLIAEQHLRADDTAHAVWLRDGVEVATGYRRNAAGYYATGADATQDHLFVLERGLSLLAGWQAEIAVVPRQMLNPGTDRLIEPVHRFKIPGTVPIDNMEAIAAIPVDAGKVEILLLSDDNFSPLQQNLLLQFELQLTEISADQAPKQADG